MFSPLRHHLCAVSLFRSSYGMPLFGFLAGVCSSFVVVVNFAVTALICSCCLSNVLVYSFLFFRFNRGLLVICCLLTDTLY